MTEAFVGSPRNQRIIRRLRSRGFSGRVLGKGLTIVTYTGRKSGRQYSIPLGYRRRGDAVVLQSKYGSDTKTWWRNFLDPGREVTLWLDGAERTGDAIASRDDRGHVTVTVTFPADTHTS